MKITRVKNCFNGSQAYQILEEGKVLAEVHVIPAYDGWLAYGINAQVNKLHLTYLTRAVMKDAKEAGISLIYFTIENEDSPYWKLVQKGKAKVVTTLCTMPVK